MELMQISLIGRHGALLMPDDPAEMAAQATRCRRLAKWSSGAVRDSLQLMADDYQARGKAAQSLASKP